MPVRDLDGWLPSSERVVRVLSDRGANGIDGLISSALGSAAAGVGRVVLVLGDVSFLHDLNALVAARLHHLDLTVVLVNNDGGGIFSFLPQHATDDPAVGLPARYEELFGTPHGIEPGPLVEAFGFAHRRGRRAIDRRRAGARGDRARGHGARAAHRAWAQPRAPSGGGGGGGASAGDARARRRRRP